MLWYACTPRSCNNYNNHGKWRVNRCHQCAEPERDPARLPSELLRDELEGGAGEEALGGGTGEGALGGAVGAEEGTVVGGVAMEGTGAGAGAGAGGEVGGGGAGETALAEAGAGDGARAGGDEGARAEEEEAGLGEVGVFRSSGWASTSSTCSCRAPTTH